MNVTVKLEDRLVKEARHRAVDAGLSLSAWLARLIEEEVRMTQGEGVRPNLLLEALGDRSTGELDWEVPELTDEPAAADFGR